MLFNFQLRALADIHPWEASESPHLHWFGLTDGWYWFQMNESNEIFCYTPELLAYWRERYDERTISSQYIDYYVVRVWEDLLVMLADGMLEPLPPRLAQKLERDEQMEQWQKQTEQWQQEIDIGDDEWEIYCQANGWWERRMLDAGYLRIAPRLWFWNDGTFVHCFWDNSQISVHDLPVWKARKGRIKLTIEQFLEELISFHMRLLAAMEERIQEVKQGKLSPEIEIDIHQLEKEQLDRGQWLTWRLKYALERPASDWEAVIEATEVLKKRPKISINKQREDEFEEE